LPILGKFYNPVLVTLHSPGRQIVTNNVRGYGSIDESRVLARRHFLATKSRSYHGSVKSLQRDRQHPFDRGQGIDVVMSGIS